MYLRSRGEALEGVFEYSTDLFTATTVRRMADSFLAFLAAAVADPASPIERLPMVAPAERRRMTNQWNCGPEAVPHDFSLTAAFEEQVRLTPHATAVSQAGHSLNYLELDEQANRLAARLRRAGVTPESLVGIHCDRSPEMIVSVLGVLKSGGAYLPLDVAYPPGRIEFMIADARPDVVLTTESHREQLPPCAAEVLCVDALGDDQDQASHVDLQFPSASAEDLAYVIYTSGSTGQPKGVEVTHGAIANHAAALAKAMCIDPGDRMLQIISLSFDAAAEEIFPTLIAGGELVLYPRRESIGGENLLDFCAAADITHLHLPTALWNDCVAVVTRRAVPPTHQFKTVLVGGEGVCPRRLADWRRHVGGATRFLHAYGVTEAAVTTTLYEPASLVPGALARLPIGRPIAGSQVYVLDRNQEILPAGAVGELYIAGTGLARGYRDRDRLTRERFVTLQLPDTNVGRAYRTGDRVRVRADGELEFLGRADQQLKVRGWRIEPGEVETVLVSHPHVRSAAVVARQGHAGTELVAYVVAADAGRLNGNLRRYLLDRLPEPLVPSRTVTLDRLPLAPGGKIDYHALSEMAAGQKIGIRQVTPPRTETERRLAPIWQRLLGSSQRRSGRRLF